jgi:hypothetical protein
VKGALRWILVYRYSKDKNVCIPFELCELAIDDVDLSFGLVRRQLRPGRSVLLPILPGRKWLETKSALGRWLLYKWRRRRLCSVDFAKEYVRVL